MRSIIIGAALVFSVSAFPLPDYRDLSVAKALVTRDPQSGPLRDRGGLSDDKIDEEETPAWGANVPKSFRKMVSKPSESSPPSTTAISTPNGSPPPPHPALPLHEKLDSNKAEEVYFETALKFSAGPRTQAAGSGNGPSSWALRRRSTLRKQDRPPPKSAPWNPPNAQQPKSKSGPPPAREPPFPDAEEDNEKIKAVHRMQREPNAWELDQ